MKIFVCPVCGSEDMMFSSDCRFAGCIKGCVFFIMHDTIAPALGILKLLKERIAEAEIERNVLVDRMLMEMEDL
jgi:hypothetical protein